MKHLSIVQEVHNALKEWALRLSFFEMLVGVSMVRALFLLQAKVWLQTYTLNV